MHPYIPQNPEGREQMVRASGISSVEDLFKNIPGEILPGKPFDLPDGMCEEDVRRALKGLAGLDRRGVCFMGGGSYDHLIPSVVRAVASLPSFVTAYTPYQPEISQGILQCIFEYQSMICALTGMDVSNASLYDGASAAAEAAALGISERRKSTDIIVSSTMHPFAVQCVRTWASGRGVNVRLLPEKDGASDISALDALLNEKTAVAIMQSPNVYGVVEDYTGAAEKIHAAGALFAVSSDPLSLGMQKPQGEWGADIAIGDTQVLGLPLGFGGPYCGYMAVTDRLMRKIPGRVVGRTTDSRGDTCYVLTLQAREQHIKRERATSNICSNQALMALTSAVYLSVMGPCGVKEAARQSFTKSHCLARALAGLPGVSLKYPEKPFWCEFALEFESAGLMENLLGALKSEGIYGGVRLSTLTRKEKDTAVLLVSVTEKRTGEEIERYIRTARRVLK